MRVVEDIIRLRLFFFFIYLRLLPAISSLLFVDPRETKIGRHLHYWLESNARCIGAQLISYLSICF